MNTRLFILQRFEYNVQQPVKIFLLYIYANVSLILNRKETGVPGGKKAYPTW